MGKSTSSVMLTAIVQTLGVRATTERWVRMSLSGAGAQSRSCSNHHARLNPYDFNVSGSRTVLLLFQMLKKVRPALRTRVSCWLPCVVLALFLSTACRERMMFLCCCSTTTKSGQHIFSPASVAAPSHPSFHSLFHLLLPAFPLASRAVELDLKRSPGTTETSTLTHLLQFTSLLLCKLRI